MWTIIIKWCSMEDMNEIEKVMDLVRKQIKIEEENLLISSALIGLYDDEGEYDPAHPIEGHLRVQLDIERWPENGRSHIDNKEGRKKLHSEGEALARILAAADPLNLEVTGRGTGLNGPIVCYSAYLSEKNEK